MVGGCTMGERESVLEISLPMINARAARGLQKMGPTALRDNDPM